MGRTGIVGQIQRSIIIPLIILSMGTPEVAQAQGVKSNPTQSTAAGNEPTVLDKILDILTGKPFRTAAGDNAPSGDVQQSKDIKDFFSQLQAIHDQAVNASQGDAKSKTQVADAGRAQLEQMRASLKSAQDSLKHMETSLLRGDLGDIVTPEFWASCKNAVGPRAAELLAAGIDTPKPGTPPATRPQALTPGGLADVDKCGRQALDIANREQQKIDELKIAIAPLEKIISDAEAKLKTLGLSEKERQELIDAIADANKKKEPLKKELKHHEDGKKAADLWAIVTGIVEFVAGVVAVVYGDEVDGWSLIATGTATIANSFDGKEGRDVTEVVNAPSDDQSVAKTADANTIDVASSAPAVDDKSLIDMLAKENFSQIDPAKPVKGNIELFYNSTAKAIIIARTDTLARIVTIDLHNVTPAVGIYWRDNTNLLDLVSVSKWSLVTKNGSVQIAMQAKFPNSDFQLTLLDVSARREPGVSPVAADASTDSKKGSAYMALADFDPDKP
jgi:hypothetical protein